MRLPRPIGLRILGTLIVVVPFAVALKALWPTHSYFGPIYCVLASVAIPLWRERALLRLSRVDYKTVRSTVRSGRPSGRSDLDELARNELAGYGNSSRSDRVFMAIIPAALIAVPMVDAFLRSPWWVLAALPGPLLFLRYRPRKPEVPAQERLRILLAEMEPT